MLRVNQSKQRKEKNAWNDVQSYREHEQSLPPKPPLPRERLSESSDLISEHPAPEVYWITPQHASPDVVEISDGSGVLAAIYSQQGLRTGDCLSMKRKFTLQSFYSEMEWIC